MRTLTRRAAMCTLAISALIAIGGTASATTNLIKNGSFEKPVVPVGGYDLFAPGQSFAGWRVVGAAGNLGIVSGKYQGDGITFNAKTGAQWTDLTGTSKTVTGIAQTVATTPGTSYHLTFWVGNVYDPNGIYGVSSTVKVYLNGILKMTAKNSIHPANHTQAWKKFTLTITAASSQTKISFINGDPPTDDSNGLDAVQLS